jgi:hypothetical protein
MEQMNLTKAMPYTLPSARKAARGLFLAGLLSSLAAAQSSANVITSVADVRSLSTEDATRGLSVKLRGVVTFYDDGLYSRFLQDDAAGIYLLESTNTPALKAGETIELEGNTAPGEFAPVVMPTSVRVVGKGKLPSPKAVDLEEMVGGTQDSQWVEFRDRVRAVHFERVTGYHVLDFAKGTERFSVYVKELPMAQPDELVGATVRVRGVCATLFNHQRQLFGVRLLVPNGDGLVVEKVAGVKPFELPAQKINTLLRFAPAAREAGRVKVTGTVVFAEPGKALFIQDEEGGLHCQIAQRELPELGAKVEVVGFPARGEYTPILEDAIVRKLGTGKEPEIPSVDVNEILTGAHDCRLVQLPAKVLGNVQRGLTRFLLLESGGLTFQAFIPQGFIYGTLADLKEGSEVVVRGVCVIERGNQWQAGDEWRASSFRLLLRSPKDVTLVQAPSQVKLPEGTSMIVGLVILAAGLLGWVVVLRRKLHARTAPGR